MLSVSSDIVLAVSLYDFFVISLVTISIIPWEYKPKSFISNNSSKRYIVFTFPFTFIVYLLLDIGISPNFDFIVVGWKSFGVNISLSL